MVIETETNGWNSDSGKWWIEVLIFFFFNLIEAIYFSNRQTYSYFQVHNLFMEFVFKMQYTVLLSNDKIELKAFVMSSEWHAVDVAVDVLMDRDLVIKDIRAEI